MNDLFLYLSKFEFAFCLLICIFIFVFFAFIIKQKFIRLVFLSLFGMTSSIFLFEVYFAVLMPNLLMRGNDPLSVKDLSTRTIEVCSSTVISDNNIQYITHKNTVYPNFFRYTKNNSQSKDGFIFLGCSFMYGSGLEDEDTLPYYFSKLYNFDKFVLNCSGGGRGTNFAFNVMNSDIIYDFNSDIKVKYFIYSVIFDHINRNFNISTFNLADDNFILKNNKFIRTKEPLGFLKIIFKKSYMFHRLFINFINDKNRTFHEQYFIEQVTKMNKLALEKYNAELIVVLWPDVEEQIIEKLKEKNINIILLDKKFDNEEYRIKNDGHPNGKANEEIAQILFNYINNKS